MMKLFRSVMLPAMSAIVFTSCASVFCGSRAKVVFDTNVPVESAVLTIDGKRQEVNSFPYKTRIKRGFSDTEDKAEAENYEPVRFMIYKCFNPVSVINLCDVLGWGIDIATGAMMKPEQNSYEIIFRVPNAKEENEKK